MASTNAPRLSSISRPDALAASVLASGQAVGALRPIGVPGAPDCTVLTDPIRLGNGHVLAELVDRAMLGRHTLIMGSEGVGKTRILEDLVAVVAGRRVGLDGAAQKRARRKYVEMPQGAGEAYTLVYVAEAGPNGRLVDALARAFHVSGNPRLARHPAADARRGVRRVRVDRDQEDPPHRGRAAASRGREPARPGRRSGRAPRLLIVLDALDRASASQGLFLRELQQRATIIGAIRALPQSRSLRTFIATFGQIKVEPLGQEHTAALFEYFVSRYAIASPDRRHYRREVLRRAEGNPAILRAMMHDGAQSQIVTEQDVRDLQARDDAPFFNLGLIYVFFLIGLGSVRVFMSGVQNTDLTIVLTIVTVLGYLIFPRSSGVLFMFTPRPESK